MKVSIKINMKIKLICLSTIFILISSTITSAIIANSTNYNMTAIIGYGSQISNSLNYNISSVLVEQPTGKRVSDNYNLCLGFPPYTDCEEETTSTIMHNVSYIYGPSGLIARVDENNNSYYKLSDGFSTKYINSSGAEISSERTDAFGDPIDNNDELKYDLMGGHYNYDEDTELYLGSEYDPSTGGLGLATIDSYGGISIVSSDGRLLDYFVPESSPGPADAFRNSFVDDSYGFLANVMSLGYYGNYMSWQYYSENPPSTWGGAFSEGAYSLPVVGQVKAAIETKSNLARVGHIAGAVGTGFLLGYGGVSYVKGRMGGAKPLTDFYVTPEGVAIPRLGKVLKVGETEMVWLRHYTTSTNYKSIYTSKILKGFPKGYLGFSTRNPWVYLTDLDVSLVPGQGLSYGQGLKLLYLKPGIAKSRIAYYDILLPVKQVQHPITMTLLRANKIHYGTTSYPIPFLERLSGLLSRRSYRYRLYSPEEWVLLKSQGKLVEKGLPADASHIYLNKQIWRKYPEQDIFPWEP